MFSLLVRSVLTKSASPPGSGKSTFGYPLADRVNELLGCQVVEPVHVDTEDITATPGAQAGKGLTAVCVGLDGWHFSRAELDTFPVSFILSFPGMCFGWIPSGQVPTI